VRIEQHRIAHDGPSLGTLFGGVMVLAAGLAALWLRLGLPQPACHFRNWTGVPCPTCGSTRMVEALLRGEIVAALGWNPLVFLALAGVAVWAVVSTVNRLFGLPALRVIFGSRERQLLRVGAVTVLAAAWAYLIWRGA